MANYKILQIKSPSSSKNFAHYNYLVEKLGGFDITDYEIVYEGEISSNDSSIVTLEKIFEMFNVGQINGFRGHSLSVSDVVVLDGTIWYCDSIGWVNVGKFEEAGFKKF